MEKFKMSRQQHVEALRTGLAALAAAVSRKPLTDAQRAEAALTLTAIKLAFESNEVIQDRFAAIRQMVDASAEAM